MGDQALTADTKRAIMMVMCPPVLERHLVLNSDRYPEVRAAIRDYAEQMRKSGPMDIGDMEEHADDEYHGEWEETQALGQRQGGAKGKGKNKGRNSKGSLRKGRREEVARQDLAGGPRLLPIYVPQCGEKRHKAAQCGKRRGRRRGKKGVYGMEEGHADEAGTDAAEDLGDLDCCVVEEFGGGGGPYHEDRCGHPSRPPYQD